jgi:ectoine hydroxylase-related dioxygenase (phytanoyl-CoA dioxygenase family)
MLGGDGFRMERDLLGAREVDELRALVPSDGAGWRTVLDDQRVHSWVSRLRERLLPPGCAAVRGLLFDKSPDANWALGWHRDTSVAVVERRDVPGWGPWTVKEDVTHAIAPRAFLATMQTLRVHLDDVDEDNGPLRVKRGSHLTDDGPEHTCLANAGDVLIFSPLLLHASSSARRPRHRRVLQLEFASTPFPAPLRGRWWVT